MYNNNKNKTHVIKLMLWSLSACMTPAQRQFLHTDVEPYCPCWRARLEPAAASRCPRCLPAPRGAEAWFPGVSPCWWRRRTPAAWWWSPSDSSWLRCEAACSRSERRERDGRQLCLCSNTNVISSHRDKQRRICAYVQTCHSSVTDKTLNKNINILIIIFICCLDENCMWRLMWFPHFCDCKLKS